MYIEEERSDLMLKKFDGGREIDHITEWIRRWFGDNGKDAAAVIGISGGKDSTVAAALLVKALGPQRVLGVMMPNGIQADFSDAEQVVKHLGIKSMVYNIKPAMDSMLLGFAMSDVDGEPLKISDDTKINLPPRIRMAVLYAVAQSLPDGGRVCNTCNRSEDYIGYSTKFGDSAGDFAPLAQYTVAEVRAIGHALGLPAGLVDKAPADGLCGQTDEEKIGFSYDVLDKYLLTGVCEDESTRTKIERMHVANFHKLQPMQFCPNLNM